MKKTLQHIFISLFLALCLLPVIGMPLFGESSGGANEIAAPRPQWGPTVLNQVSDYIADRFALRQELVSAWSWLHERLLGSSAEEQVVLGREGWLYYGETLDDYAGLAMSEEELRLCAEHLRTLQDYLDSQGVQFLFTVAPNKNSLYPERMPGRYPAGHENSNLARLTPILEEYGVRCCDLTGPLSERVLYYATDSHWTAEGAALAADTLLAQLGKDTDFAAGPFGTGDARPGDLYEMLYPTGRGREAEVLYLPGHAHEALGPTNKGNAVTIDTACPGQEGKLLCFRDSFGIALYPYLADAYGSATFTRRTAYDLSWYAGQGYDTVLIELVERNLPQLLQEPELPHGGHF